MHCSGNSVAISFVRLKVRRGVRKPGVSKVGPDCSPANEIRALWKGFGLTYKVCPFRCRQSGAGRAKAKINIFLKRYCLGCDSHHDLPCEVAFRRTFTTSRHPPPHSQTVSPKKFKAP